MNSGQWFRNAGLRTLHIITITGRPVPVAPGETVYVTINQDGDFIDTFPGLLEPPTWVSGADG